MQTEKTKTAKGKKKETPPKVSVVIPFYNRKKYVKECLDSVLNSTLSDIEVICVDDGSADGTTVLVKRLARKDKKIKFLSCPHEGAYKARWAGTKIARGEYVHFMDSDDMIEPFAYEELYNLCKKNNLDYLGFNTIPFIKDESTDAEKRKKDGFAQHYYLAPQCCDKIQTGVELMESLCKNKSFFIGFPMRVVRRELLSDELMPECNAYWHADNFYTVVWLYNSAKAMAVDKPYYLRRVHRDSITMVKNSEALHFRSMLQVILSLCRFKTFADRCTKLGTAESDYMFRMVRSLNKRRGKMSAEEMFAEIDKAMESFPLDQITFLKMCFIPLMQKWDTLTKKTAAT